MRVILNNSPKNNKLTVYLSPDREINIYVHRTIMQRQKKKDMQVKLKWIAKVQCIITFSIYNKLL